MHNALNSKPIGMQWNHGIYPISICDSSHLKGAVVVLKIIFFSERVFYWLKIIPLMCLSCVDLYEAWRLATKDQMNFLILFWMFCPYVIIIQLNQYLEMISNWLLSCSLSDVISHISWKTGERKNLTGISNNAHTEVTCGIYAVPWYTATFVQFLSLVVIDGPWIAGKSEVKAFI